MGWQKGSGIKRSYLCLYCHRFYFLLGHCIATDFPTYKKTSPNSRPGFFLELGNPYPEHLIGVAFFRFSGHLCQEVIAFLQISCSIFP